MAHVCFNIPELTFIKQSSANFLMKNQFIFFGNILHHVIDFISI